MKYIELEKLVIKRNKYKEQFDSIIEDKDFQDAILSNDLSIYEEDSVLFISAIQECLTKVIKEIEILIKEKVSLIKD